MREERHTTSNPERTNGYWKYFSYFKSPELYLGMLDYQCSFSYIELECKAESWSPQFQYVRQYEEKGKLNNYRKVPKGK